MEVQLQLIQGLNVKNFPRFTDALWISKRVSDELGKENDYVKITCTLPLQEFTVFAKLEILNEQNDIKGAFFNPEFLPKKHLINESVTVSIEPLSNMKKSSSITIELSQEDMMSWSEEEIQFARNQFKTQNRIAYNRQKLYIKSGTSKLAKGQITQIFPKGFESEAFSITDETLIIFEGLPENRQKTINFSKIGGLDNLINTLRNTIQIPMAYPELLESFQIEPPKGLLLFGSPGNGKTMIARAIAQSLGATFVSIEGPELNSKYVGEGERKLREKFEEAAKHKNCVLFIDEIDAIASSRDKENTADFHVTTVATLLNLMDGIRSAKGIFVIGATNRIQTVDKALRRPGRFELEFEVPLPNRQARLDILQKTFALENNPMLSEDITSSFLEHISEWTHGYSGADLVSLYRQSVMHTISKEIEYDVISEKFQLSEKKSILLHASDVLHTIKKITPSSSRGYENNEKHIVWDDLMNVESVKHSFELIHRKISRLPKIHLSQRPRFLNVVIIGEKGCGKRTTVYSFSKKYNYEWCPLDLMRLSSHDTEKNIDILNSAIQRGKQMAPSILYLYNFHLLEKADIFVEKLKKELADLSSSLPILCVIALENSKSTDNKSLSGYQGFNDVISFPNRISEDTLSRLSDKYRQPTDFFEQWKDTTLPIGALISQIEQKINQL